MPHLKVKARRLKAMYYADFEQIAPERLASEIIQIGRADEPDIERLLKQFQPLLDSLVERALEDWQKIYRRKFGQFLTNLQVLASKLRQLHQERETITAGEIRWELQQTLRSIYEWTESLTWEINAANLWEALGKQFAAELQNTPEVAQITLPPDYWRVKWDDPLRLRLWKRRAAAERALKGTLYSGLNQIRRLAGKTPLDPALAYRRFDLHSFLITFLQLPVAEFLLVEWLQWLHVLANQFYALHLKTIEIRDDFSFLNDLETATVDLRPAELLAPLEKLQRHIKAITAEIQHLEPFETEARGRFQIQKMDIFRKIREQWRFAGTQLMSQADFGEKHLTRRWAQLEAELAKGKEGWIHHLQAEQGEWRAGLELSLLQLQTVQNYCETLSKVRQNVQTQLVPAFTSTLETVVALTKNIARMKPGGETRQLIAIKKENRALLRRLQREKMPLMMDTLIMVQLDDLTKDYARRVRNAIEILSDGHRIFLKRDLTGLIPKSETDKTHLLKTIVLDDLFSKFKQMYQALQAQYRHSLEKMIRNISEMDETVEVTLEAALLRLEWQNDAAGFAESRKLVLEELGQIYQQVSQLIAQARQFAAESEKKLLTLTQTFENQLLALADTDSEKKIEAHLLLARATAKEKLRNYRRRLLTMVKNAPADLLEASLSAWHEFRDNYFRLRQMTGLAAEKSDSGEKLIRFLTDTEERIKALPYVYQRLYRLAPLSNERFFSARKAELELLKQEFDLWQHGKFTATALIGERGSGITTLLNFAQQKIYADYPILKMNFLEGRSIFTDEALFRFLKTAFQPVDLNGEPANIEDLENKINALNGRKVIIVENLQHLFLRTTYGFDALERFMLFVSRTYQKIHWVMTCSLYSWAYFSKVINIDEYVQRKIVFGPLPRKEFEEIILSRHRASGYQLYFQATDEITRSRRYRKLRTDRERQKYLQRLFFEQLTELAAGNISVALLFWLRSYAEFSEDKLIIPATINFDPSFLYQLPAEELFTLAAFLQHDTLSTEDHALIFHQDIRESHLLLNRMANKGFLVQQAHGYRIHPFLFRPVVQVLKSDHIIH